MEGTRADPSRWLEHHGDALFRYALLHLGDRDAAEQRVQETLLAALEARDSFQGQSSERTWLIGILRHKISDAFRRRRRGPREQDAGADAVAAIFTASGHWCQAPGPWPEGGPDLLDREGLRQDLERCLARLDPPLREAFILRELQGLEPRGIREILGLTATNLSTRLYRARALLRACLEGHGFGTRT